MIGPFFWTFLISAIAFYFFLYRYNWIPFFKGIVILSALWLALSSIGYLFMAGFYDHVEPAIAIVGARLLNGGPLYPDYNGLEHYQLVYGPWSMILSAVAQNFLGDPIYACKVPGVVSLFLVFLLLFFSLPKLGLATQNTSFFLGILALIFLGFENITYWNRTDPYLMLVTSLSFWSVIQYGLTYPRGVYLINGALMGLAMQMKIHAVIYFLPIFIWYLEFYRQKILVKNFILALLAFAVFAVLPFMHPLISVKNFFNLLHITMAQGLIFRDAIRNFSYILPFLILLVALRFHKQLPWSFYGLVFVCGTIAAISSRIGAGDHHFLPLVIVVFVFTISKICHLNFKSFKPKILSDWLMSGTQNASPTEQESKVTLKHSLVLRALVFALLFAALDRGYQRQKMIVHQMGPLWQRTQEYNDFKAMAANLKGDVQLGYGGDANYESSFYQPWLIKRGSKALFSPAAMMEFDLGKVKLPPIVNLYLESCQTSYFILPKENGPKTAPWTITNWYTGKPLFDESFRQTFFRHYKIKQSSKYYDLWECERSQSSTPQ